MCAKMTGHRSDAEYPIAGSREGVDEDEVDDVIIAPVDHQQVHKIAQCLSQGV
jgi:hypothetical protein